MTIDQLNEMEDVIFQRVIGIEGTLEEKAMQVEAKGIYDDYKQIHSQYSDLANLDNEALKRALFIQWYALVEPGIYTGIGDINLRAERQVIDILNEQIGQNKIDSELYAMVSYYAGWEFVFDRFENCNSLKELLKNRLSYEVIIERIKSENLTNRGQMGYYWYSIVNSD